MTIKAYGFKTGGYIGTVEIKGLPYRAIFDAEGKLLDAECKGRDASMAACRALAAMAEDVRAAITVYVDDLQGVIKAHAYKAGRY